MDAASGIARTLSHGMSLRLLLRYSTLRGARVLAGAEGLDRVVRRINMMTTPEIVPWVQENELLLTTSYPLPRDGGEFAGLLTELDGRGLAALAVKLGKYIDRIPEPTLRRADELRFPLLEIPHEVRFDDIVSEVLTGIANRQAAILSRSEEIYRAFVEILLYGGGLTEITAKLSELLAAVVVVVDADDHVLAETGLGEASKWLIYDGRLRLDERRTDIEVFPVTAGSLHCGRIVVVGGERSLDTSLALERAATVAALDMTKKMAVAAVERKYQSDFLHDLLVGRLDKPGDVETRGRLLGWDLSRPLAVVVAELHPDPPAAGPGDRGSAADGSGAGAGAGGAGSPGRNAATDIEGLRARLSDLWVATVRGRDRSAAAAAFGEEFVALIGADPAQEPPPPGPPPAGSASPAPAGSAAAGPDAAEPGSKPGGEVAVRVAAGIAAGMAVARQPLYFGVSRPVTELHQLPEAYKQASRAVKVGLRTGGPHRVTTFDSLGVLRLLSIIEDADELRSFVDDTLGPVLSRGAEESADLLNTLSVLIDCNLNAAAAAKRLHFHYNTVRYRIAKLERLLGPFSSDRHLCHRLSIALQIMQLSGGLGSSSHGLTTGFGPG